LTALTLTGTDIGLDLTRRMWSMAGG